MRDLQLILQQTGSYISGSAVLYLLHPGFFYPNDVDFYVNQNGFPRLLHYLIDHGYKLYTNNGCTMQLLALPQSPESLVSDTYARSYNFSESLLIVLYMHHQSSPSVKVNIIVSRETHPVAAIIKFHSTIVMNFFAWYGLVSLYPRWMMRNVGLINNKKHLVSIIIQWI